MGVCVVLLCCCVVCVCVLCKNEKECRVGMAFVRIAQAATQCPCSPSLQAPLLTTTSMCTGSDSSISFVPVVREVLISVIE